MKQFLGSFGIVTLDQLCWTNYLRTVTLIGISYLKTVNSYLETVTWEQLLGNSFLGKDNCEQLLGIGCYPNKDCNLRTVTLFGNSYIEKFVVFSYLRTVECVELLKNSQMR